MDGKGHKVAFSTFMSWGKEKVIGFKKECIDGKTFVNFVYCIALETKMLFHLIPLVKVRQEKRC